MRNAAYNFALPLPGARTVFDVFTEIVLPALTGPVAVELKAGKGFTGKAGLEDGQEVMKPDASVKIALGLRPTSCAVGKGLSLLCEEMSRR